MGKPYLRRSRKNGKVLYYQLVYIEADGTRTFVKGPRDKSEAEAMLRELEHQVTRKRAGLVDEAAQSVVDHAQQPIAAALDEFVAYLRSLGRSAQYVRDTRRHVLRVLGGGEAERVGQINLGRTRAGLAKVAESTRRKGRGETGERPSHATYNRHRSAVMSFVSWLEEGDRLPPGRLRKLASLAESATPRRVRRTITPADFGRLVLAAEGNGPIREVPGPTRALAYRTVATTGLRYAELLSLRVADFELAGPAPRLRLSGAHAKNGRRAELPLTEDLAADLAAAWSHLAPESPAFPLPRNRGAELLRADLAACDPPIPYVDAGGRVFDFHSLRAEAATLLDAAGAAPAVIRDVLRHADVRMTNRYLRPVDAAMAEAVRSVRIERPARPNADNNGQAGATPALHEQGRAPP